MTNSAPLRVTHTWRPDGDRIVDERWICDDHDLDLVCPAEHPLPDDVREYLERTVGEHPVLARELLTKYSKRYPARVEAGQRQQEGP